MPVRFSVSALVLSEKNEEVDVVVEDESDVRLLIFPTTSVNPRRRQNKIRPSKIKREPIDRWVVEREETR